MDGTKLRANLRRIGRRLLAVRGIAALGWGLMSALGLLLAVIWFDLLWELPPGPRIAAAVAAPALAIALFVGITWAAWRRCLPTVLAGRLDQAAGTGGQILSGVDLLAERTLPPLSAGLAALAVDRAERLAAAVPAGRVAPWKPASWPLGLLGALAGAVTLVGLTLPRFAETEWLRFADPFGDHPPYSRIVFQVEPGDVEVVYGKGLEVRATTEGGFVDRLNLVLQAGDGSSEETLPLFTEPDGSWRATVTNVTIPGRYFVRAAAGRSRRFALNVLTVPHLEGVRVRVVPPAYTNRPAFEGVLPPAGLAGLPGTRVQVWAKSNRPLSAGRLRPAKAEVSGVDLEPVGEDASEVTGTLEIRQAMTLHLTVIDQAGQASTEPCTIPVALLTDERPIVRLLEPPELSLATPTGTLPVTIAAEDDYGLTRVELYRSLNDSRALPQVVPVPQPPPTRLTETLSLSLAAFRLTPGDEIKLYARAQDNDPGGAKGAESPIALVRIISQEEFERMVRVKRGMELLQAKYREAQRRLESAAAETDRLRKKTRSKPATAEVDTSDRAELRQLAAQLRAEAEAFRAAAAKKLGYDLDQHLSPHLERLSRRLEKAANDAEALAALKNLRSGDLARALEQMSEMLDRERQVGEKEVIAPLEQLGAVLPLLEDASRFVILYQRQRALANRLASLKGKDRPEDPTVRARMRDLQAEQEEIRKALIDLLEEMESHLAKIPEGAFLDRMDGFRESVRNFIRDVLKSGAIEAMADAEAGLAEFSGTRGHASAKEAADILEKFINRCQGQGGLMAQGLRGLRFQPCLGEGLGETVAQLLADAGLMPGSGAGAGQGQGGSSAMRNTLDNIGLYGGLPGVGELPRTGSSSGSRGAASRGGRGGSTEASRPGSAAGAEPTRATGSAEGLVPSAYRRRVAEYFQRVADETGGK